MATFVQTALDTLISEFDVSTDHKAVSLVLTNEVQDDTRYGASRTARTSIPGLNKWTAAGEGFNDFVDDALDERLFGKIALADELLTIVPLGATVSQVAYFGEAVQGEYQPASDDIGEILAFRWAAEGTGKDGMIRGSVVFNAQPSSSGNGTAFQLGAVAAAESVFLGVHFIAASAAITVTLESDDAEGFPSATTQITAAAQSAPGHQFLSSAGAVTDDWWRLEYTTAGGTFDIIAVVGIQ